MAPNGQSWRVGLPGRPGAETQESISLRDESLSISAVWGKAFTEGGEELGHVLDPRTGEPVRHARWAAVTGPEATVTDALSTALLVLGLDGRPALETAFPEYRLTHIE
jgi:thiamine biosynthesis lipoprotein